MISINRQWQREREREYRLFFVISLCDFSFVFHSLLVPRSIHALKGAFGFVAVAVGTVCQQLFFIRLFVPGVHARRGHSLTLLNDSLFSHSLFLTTSTFFSQLSSLFIWSTLVTAGGRPSVMCASLCWANWRLVWRKRREDNWLLCLFCCCYCFHPAAVSAELISPPNAAAAVRLA